MWTGRRFSRRPGNTVSRWRMWSVGVSRFPAWDLKVLMNLSAVLQRERLKVTAVIRFSDFLLWSRGGEALHLIAERLNGCADDEMEDASSNRTPSTDRWIFRHFKRRSEEPRLRFGKLERQWRQMAPLQTKKSPETQTQNNFKMVACRFLFRSAAGVVSSSRG